MQNKTVIVRVKGGIAYCEFKGDTPVRADIFYDDEENILKNIYVGYVKDIVKNIGCAFVEYAPGKKAYLQLSDEISPVFLNPKNTDKLCQGDRIIVQIKKAAVRTKDAVCTTEFELAGRYTVISRGKEAGSIAFSNKISDKAYKNSALELLSGIDQKGFNILVRTAACGVDISEVISEAKSLINEAAAIIERARTRDRHQLLKKAENPLYAALRELKYSEKDRIITDDLDIYTELLGLYENENLMSVKPELYKDELLPLHKLYSFKRIYEDISSRKVWLKSGAYIIIDYTEAMTVIDVNTGKYDKGSDREAAFFKINLEAAAEIARHLSLRNISGIIIVDFIDMKDSENRNKLLLAMKKYVAEDRIKTTVVDFTKLNLMELTRSKTRDLIKVRGDLFL